MPLLVTAAAAARSLASPAFTRRAITGFPHAGHGPRQVTLPLGAVICTRLPQVQVAATGKVPRLFAVMVLAPCHRKSYGVGMTRAGNSPERLRRLAEGVRRSERAHRDALTCRNNEIIEANHGGMSFGAIAAATGLNRQYVQDIVTNHERREPGNGTGDRVEQGSS